MAVIVQGRAPWSQSIHDISDDLKARLFELSTHPIDYQSPRSQRRERTRGEFQQNQAAQGRLKITNQWGASANKTQDAFRKVSKQSRQQSGAVRNHYSKR